ncbi:nitroreductase family deazaflavin-dependent oxidoreductase [Mycobacterium sp. M1]|uniref:Nitroreductase family deazaflavin-dependent oxidoreductase n=1 Tax=Mycolicibacter acidiphilus TaxID=2835306 RepID=A0ABS5RM21_9MYCO|nr:nitroreductase/quinone reductase family protein [Mycolicibacter acidiphilus]MBS9535342.1 nitroreductase family deazaflavin-dependent oxidoreductase [Mycolicibacter acidiphilus]
MTENPFPAVRWGKDPGSAMRRAAGAVIGTKAGAWCVRKLTPLDRWLLGHSNGRWTIFGPIAAPLLLLTTTGRKSGERRQIPLAYMQEGERLFLVGSNFGQAHHPAWALNLLADPNAWVTMGGTEIPVLATPLTGAEHDRVYGKFVDYISNYANYEQRTQRDIRVFALTRR